ncbi:MAG: hypothetical protein J1E38_03150 [Paramuribaculum sp.]|nr:hypothetical protein [Paramuribaculum sp.]
MKGLREIKYKILSGAMALLAGWLTWSCADDIEMPSVTPDGGNSEYVLRLKTGSATAAGSRADEHYQDDQYAQMPEEAIGRVDLFFFYTDDDSGNPFFTYELEDANKVTTADLTIRLPKSLVDNAGNSIYVYALVNLPDDITVNTAENRVGGKLVTLGELKEIRVDAPEFSTKASPESFVMRGGATATITGTGDEMLVKGTIRLERLASKVRLWAEIPSTIYLDENGNTITRETGESEDDWNSRVTETWESVPSTDGKSNVELFFYNMTTSGRIDGDLGTVSERKYANVDRKSSQEVIRRLSDDQSVLVTADKDSKYTYTHATAYYSYPNEWDSSSPTEEHRSYVVIGLPWKNGTDYKMFYYQIPVNAIESNGIKADCMEPNHYYRIKVRLGMLGSVNLGEPLEVDASYEVVDWVNLPVDVNIKDNRYLVVDKNWVMNNTHTITIPFSSSHKTIITGCYVNFFRYYEPWGNDDNANTSNPNVPKNQDPASYHDKTDFVDWLNAADGTAGVGRAGEGLIVNGKTGEELYYKSEYFNDPYLGYTYYVGHEQPKTVKRNLVKLDETIDRMNKQDIEKWELYNRQYDNINAVYTYDIDNEKKEITFTHPLILWEDLGDRYVPEILEDKDTKTQLLRDEYSRYEIIIKLRHEDWTSGDGLYEETIYITQYPGMYIEVSHNYGSIGSNQETRHSFNEFVIVNGLRLNNTYNECNGTARPLLASYNDMTLTYGSNNNPNMYVIHTTQLSEGNELLYELGDPRTIYYNNDLSSRSTTSSDGRRDDDLTDQSSNERTVTSWNGTQLPSGISGSNYNMSLARATHIVDNVANWQLQYYYPADETKGTGTKENFIAPVFRVASSFGKVSTGYRIEARRRCAVYQEAGRPAGRWRLPTKAEIKYIAQLSADKKIPILFGDSSNPDADGYYWSAQGGLAANGKGKVEDSDRGWAGPSFSPRCVYDEWYWNEIDGGKFPAGLNDRTTQFYWGDVKKDNTQTMKILNKNAKTVRK